MWEGTQEERLRLHRPPCRNQVGFKQKNMGVCGPQTCDAWLRKDCVCLILMVLLWGGHILNSNLCRIHKHELIILSTNRRRSRNDLNSAHHPCLIRHLLMQEPEAGEGGGGGFLSPQILMTAERHHAGNRKSSLELLTG